MRKLDSFLMESIRLHPLGQSTFPARISGLTQVVGTGRTAVKPYTFSNGITVPIGTRLYSPLNAIHRDQDIYPNPDQFEGFRFLKYNNNKEEKLTSLAATTSLKYLHFG